MTYLEAYIYILEHGGACRSMDASEYGIAMRVARDNNKPELFCTLTEDWLGRKTGWTPIFDYDSMMSAYENLENSAIAEDWKIYVPDSRNDNWKSGSDYSCDWAENPGEVWL